MITIPVTTIDLTDINGNPTTSYVPLSPIPANAIAVTCDGTNYTVYEPGDTVPAQFQG